MLIVICFYLVLGFMYSWVMNMVAQDEIAVWKGAVILFITGVFAMGTAAAFKDQPAVGMIAGAAVQFGVLIVLTKYIAQIAWKHAAISAAIYTALLFLVALGLRACVGGGNDDAMRTALVQ